MERYHKIQTLFKRDMDGTLTGKKGKMIRGAWTTPELEYLADNEWEFTEKVDGTNIRVGFTEGANSVEFAGRTAAAQIPGQLLAYLEDRFTPGLFHDADLRDVILFGEGYGPKIQGGGKYVQAVIEANKRLDVMDPNRMHEHKFVLFDVKIGDWWLSRKGVDDIAEKLGIDSVPTIGSGTLQDAIDIVATGITFGEFGAIKRWGSGTLESQWGNFAAEGIVARPSVPMFDRKGERIITKIKVVDFR